MAGEGGGAHGGGGEGGYKGGGVAARDEGDCLMFAAAVHVYFVYWLLCCAGKMDYVALSIWSVILLSI